MYFHTVAYHHRKNEKTILNGFQEQTIDVSGPSLR